MIAENSKKTVRGRPFPAGVSGNPGGRPKIPEDVKEAIRAACPEAVQVLIGLLHSKRELIQLEAAKTLLERGYGKPEVMSKVELNTAEPTKIIFHWMKDDTGTNNTVYPPESAERNS